MMDSRKIDVNKAAGFKAGAEWMRDELTKWNDPKEELPEPGRDVLVTCSSGSYVVDFYDPELGCFFGEHATYMIVTGWREIHEHPIP